MPSSATQAVAAEAGEPGHIAGVVWRDFKPGGGVPGKVETGELGPAGRDRPAAGQRGQGGEDRGVRRRRDVRLRRASRRAPTTRAISAQTFAKPWGGYAWLGTKLITPSLIIAYIWIWAGFAMVVIAAGLSAMPRDVLEAARTDGASEWQVFRRVTVPLLAPVLSVVFITMIINVLKVFDLVITLAPGSSQNAASVIALAMWRTSFGGINDFGVGLGDRRLPLRARRARARAQHQALPEGGLRCRDVALPTAEADGAGHASRRRSLRFVMRAPVNILLAVLGLLWLVPTLGLFLTSILPAQAFTVKGWWQIFSNPSVATWDELRRASSTTHSIMHSLLITRRDRGRRTR